MFPFHKEVPLLWFPKCSSMTCDISFHSPKSPPLVLPSFPPTHTHTHRFRLRPLPEALHTHTHTHTQIHTHTQTHRHIHTKTHRQSHTNTYTQTHTHNKHKHTDNKTK